MDAAQFRALNSAVDKALNQIIAKGSDDIFKPPVFSSSLEHEVISRNEKDFREEARRQAINFIKAGDLKGCGIGEVRKSLVVKDQYTFRQVCWLDPFESVKYLTLCTLLFDKIESARLPKGDQIVHSHRASEKEGELFDETYGYKSFRARSGELSRQYQGKWKVVTDISNFFDRIGNHSLENHLLNIGCEKAYTDLLREVLFFWAGDRRSFGVPVGSDASRIISEAVLIDIDRKLADSNIPFVRYVDDFRIFADSRSQAYAHMQKLISLLSDEGLSVNSKKTRIFSVFDNDELFPEQVAIPGGEHETIDLDKKVEVRAVRFVSGRSSVSKFYKEPGKEALDKIRGYTREGILERLSAARQEEEEELIKLAVKYFVYVDQDVSILKALLTHKLTSIFYIVDALIKEVARIPNETRVAAKEILFEEIDYKNSAYPFVIPLLRLASKEGYTDSSVINHVVDAHKIQDNILFFREAITLGYRQLSRERVRSLALVVFNTVPDCAKRAIFYAVQNCPQISDAERRPLLINMKQGAADWFVARM